jgi:hypothetical protein
MLEPGWVTDNNDRFDVFHVHFGFDAIAPEDLRIASKRFNGLDTESA